MATVELELGIKENDDLIEEVQESKCNKINEVLKRFVFHPIALLACLYFFICALDLMSISFRLLGGKLAGKALRETKVFDNPIAGLMIGMLLTVILQSSSNTTSIIITMIGTDIITVRDATFMIMGANIGTSITNTIVALGQMSNRKEFQLAFAGATVHDMFNWLSVIILLPLEVSTGYLNKLSGAIAKSMDFQKLKMKKINLLKTITSPLTKLIISIDNSILQNSDKLVKTESIIKVCCKVQIKSDPQIKTKDINETVCVSKCKFMFMNVANMWSDPLIGGIILILSLVTLMTCLLILVKILKMIFLSKFMKNAQGYINSKKCGFLTGYVAILIGCGMTILVQSSSVFTSALTPLVGTGFLSLQRMFALTLGSNIGTTVTGILSALAQDIDKMESSMQAALIHLFFNISGIVIWYPIPIIRKVPLSMAKRLGKSTYQYRWFSIVYLMIFFILIPVVTFGLSLIIWYAPLIFCLLIVFPFITISIIKIIQRKKPQFLPGWLRNWKFLPEFLRSLKPYDKILMKLFFCQKFRKMNPMNTESNVTVLTSF